jgi:hypothetical protein
MFRWCLVWWSRQRFSHSNVGLIGTTIISSSPMVPFSVSPIWRGRLACDHCHHLPHVSNLLPRIPSSCDSASDSRVLGPPPCVRPDRRPWTSSMSGQTTAPPNPLLNHPHCRRGRLFVDAALIRRPIVNPILRPVTRSEDFPLSKMLKLWARRNVKTWLGGS